MGVIFCYSYKRGYTGVSIVWTGVDKLKGPNHDNPNGERREKKNVKEKFFTDDEKRENSVHCGKKKKE